MVIKKANTMCKAFEPSSQVHSIQNMQPTSKKCMSVQKIFISIIFLVVIFCLGSTNPAFAEAVASYVDPKVGASINDKGKEIYYLIVNIGKWIIIVKGAVDVIQCVINGDFQSAKKLFMGYILAFAVLYALPWAFDEIEEIFIGM